MRSGNSENLINRIAIGVLIALIAVFCCLSLFGALGGVGEMVSSFLLGAFGYAAYAYALAGVLIAVAVIFNFKVTLEARKIVRISLLIAAGIWALHVYTASPYAVNTSYGDYLNACYVNANTAGGGFYGVISYPFQRFFTNVGALVFVCVLFFILIFVAVYPFIKSGAASKTGRIKTPKLGKGQKITVPKSPTITAFNRNKPTEFYTVEPGADEEESKKPHGTEGYDFIFPNKQGHIGDEQKNDERGAAFALGGDEMRTGDSRYFRKNDQNDTVRDLLFNKNLDRDKYREYRRSLETDRTATGNDTLERLDEAYQKTISREQKSVDIDSLTPDRIRSVLSAAEQKHKESLKPQSQNGVHDISGTNPLLRHPSEWGKKEETPIVEFEKMKEEQRELLKKQSALPNNPYIAKTFSNGLKNSQQTSTAQSSSSLPSQRNNFSAQRPLNSAQGGYPVNNTSQSASSQPLKVYPETSNGPAQNKQADEGLSVFDLLRQSADRKEAKSTPANTVYGQEKKTWSELSASSENTDSQNNTRINSTKFDVTQSEGGYNSNQKNFNQSGSYQTAPGRTQIYSHAQTAFNSHSVLNQQNGAAQSNGFINSGAQYSYVTQKELDAQREQRQSSANYNQQSAPQSAPQSSNNISNQNVQYVPVNMGGMYPYAYTVPQGFVPQGYVPQGYIPQGYAPYYPTAYAPQGYVAPTYPGAGYPTYPPYANHTPASHNATDSVQPMQSPSFNQDPSTGVYRNPNLGESVEGKPTTYAPDVERGKQLSDMAEQRKTEDETRKARLARMEELKRRQQERLAQKAQEDAQKLEREKAAQLKAEDSYAADIERAKASANELKPNSMLDHPSPAEAEIKPSSTRPSGYSFFGKVGSFSSENVNFENDGGQPKGVVYGSAEMTDEERGILSGEIETPDDEIDATELQRKKFLERHRAKKKARLEAEENKVRTAQITIDESIENTVPRKPYVAPPLDLLIPPDINEGPSEDMEEKKEALINVLAYFNVKAEVIEVICGPAFSLFRIKILEMPRGKTITWLQTLENDLAMKMAEVSVKVLAPIPGENAVGVEVSNKKRRLVRISSLLQSREFLESKTNLSFALGEDLYGKNYVCTIKSLPHLLIAGQTGAGKSCCINTLIVSLLYHASPDELRFIMIDPKRLELSVYKGIPHLLLDDIIYDADKAIKSLQWCIDEMQRRLDFFNKNGYRDIEEYNACKLQDDFVPMPRIVIIIDELAELMDRGSKTVEKCIDNLARLARAVGIHIICATQRPSVDVISGTIKNNLPSRIAFRVPTVNDSRTILNGGGAENLLGDGDLLYMNPRFSKTVRVQGGFISTEEVKAVVDFLKKNNESHYDDKIKETIYKEEVKEEASDDKEKKSSAISPKVLEALKLGMEGSLVSISMLQRKLGVGYPRAGAIYDQIERMGYLGPPQKPTNARPVTITQEEYDALAEECEEDE